MNKSQQRVDAVFIKLPAAIMADPDLTPADKLVYASLYSHAWVARGDTEVYPSIKTIATNCALSERKVCDALKKLVRLRLIKRKWRKSKAGDWASCTTEFLVLSEAYTDSDLPKHLQGPLSSVVSADSAGGYAENAVPYAENAHESEYNTKQEKGSDEQKHSSSPPPVKQRAKAWESTSFSFKAETLQRLWCDIAADYPALNPSASLKSLRSLYYGAIAIKKATGFDVFERLSDLEAGFRNWLDNLPANAQNTSRNISWLWNKNDRGNYWMAEFIHRAGLLAPKTPKREFPLSEELQRVKLPEGINRVPDVPEEWLWTHKVLRREFDGSVVIVLSAYDKFMRDYMEDELPEQGGGE